MSVPLRMALLIDTATVPARERLDFWLESAIEAYLPVQVRSAPGEQFAARMWGYDLAPLTFYRISAVANTMIRTSRTIAASDPECLHLSVVLRGRLNAAQQDRTGVARVGDLISYETSRPVVVSADRPFESLVVRVPKDVLGAEATRISSRTAVRIPGREGLPRAAVAFFRGLVGGLEDGTVTPGDAPSAVNCVLDLVRGLYADPGGAHERTRPRSRAEVLHNLRSFIEDNLGDPQLGPEQIARAGFISTRYLHRLFEAEGTSVCQWIRAARLERCRRDLLDPALAHQTILAIATRWGLPGPQHFSRVFRAAYGCSPSEFRRRAHITGGAVTGGAALA